MFNKVFKISISTLIGFVFIIFLTIPVKAQSTGTLGSISGTITWMTESLQESSTKVVISGQSTGYSTTLYPDRNFTTGNTLLPDTYSVVVSATSWAGEQYFIIGSQIVTIAEGQSVNNVNFDAFNISGLIKGDLTIGGVQTGGWIQFCSPIETDPCPVFSGYPNLSNGPYYHFRYYGFTGIALLPGNYRAHVVTDDNVDVGIIPVTIVAGEIAVNSPLHFSLNLGSISGQVTWGAENLQESSIKIEINGSTTGFSRIYYPGRNFATGAILLPDTYTVTALATSWAGEQYFVIGSRTLTITANEAITNVNFDASGASGLVKGNLEINGVSTPGWVQFCGPLVSDFCPTSLEAGNGPYYHFRYYGFTGIALLPGNYRAHIVTDGGISVVVIPITVSVGGVIDLTTPAATVQNGQNISASLGNIDVTFSEVLSSGFMTTTSGSSGTQPPSGFKLGNPPAYYYISTTATFARNVTVCISYNDATIQGSESNLKLMHFDGQRWTNITTSLDTIANIICGTTTSFSDFAVMTEPTIQDLINLVGGLNLQQGIVNSLDVKIQRALDAQLAEKNNLNTEAVNALNAFINEVEAQRGNKITNVQADDLHSLAGNLIKIIQGINQF